MSEHSLIDERIAKAKTSVFKAVFPGTTNHYDTLFGGTALKLMDEVAFITATRFSRKKVVTVSSDKVDFQQPIPGGTLIELVGEVVKLGNTSIRVKVIIYIEEMYNDQRVQAIEGLFTFVAIGKDKKPVPIL